MQNKERITVDVCCNGSYKTPLWIIGKYLTPLCFRRINIQNLGCQCLSSKMAWTQIIFLKWMRDFDRGTENCKLLLILNKCRAHV